MASVYFDSRYACHAVSQKHLRGQVLFHTHFIPQKAIDLFLVLWYNRQKNGNVL